VTGSPATAPLPPRFDPREPRVAEDPYPSYAQLRAAGPLARGGPATWLVTRHADVTTLARDTRLGHELPYDYHRVSLGDGSAARFFARILFYRDPPAHTRLRRLMAAAFTPRLVGSFRPRVQELVDDLLDHAEAAGRLDAIQDLASPLALGTICLLLGVPAADQAEVLPRAAALAHGFSFAEDPGLREETDAAADWLHGYLGELLRDSQRRPPRDDLLSRMARAAGARLAHDEVVDNCAFLFWAGFETVISLIGTGVVALTQFPDQFTRLRESPELVASAIEEFLRYDAPIQGTSRIVREPIQIGRHRIRPGRMLVLLLGSANHDERVFERPERLDIGRSPNPHVSFGGGPHHCLGSVLARAEASILFSTLTRRYAAIEAAGPSTRRVTIAWMRFHDSVPVSLAPDLLSARAVVSLRSRYSVA
jgi:cytochrome P450